MLKNLFKPKETERKQAIPGFYSASVGLVSVESKETAFILEKIPHMQRIYIQNNRSLYSDDDEQELKSSLSAILFKFRLTNYALLQVWSIRDNKTKEFLYNNFANSSKSFDCTNDEQFLYSALLEQFLFQGRAFLDFYMIYIILLLKVDDRGYVNKKKFEKLLQSAQPPFDSKASTALKYFQENVFGEEVDRGVVQANWGSLLKSLRDKIAHRDMIKHAFKSDESLFDGTPIDLPTIRDLTYDRFCQNMHNGMFFLFTELLPLLYDLEWKAGKYQDGMWETSE